MPPKLTRNDKVQSPAKNADALHEAERLVKQGIAKFSDLEGAKRRIDRKKKLAQKKLEVHRMTAKIGDVISPVLTDWKVLK